MELSLVQPNVSLIKFTFSSKGMANSPYDTLVGNRGSTHQNKCSFKDDECSYSDSLQARLVGEICHCINCVLNTEWIGKPIWITQLIWIFWGILIDDIQVTISVREHDLYIVHNPLTYLLLHRVIVISLLAVCCCQVKLKNFALSVRNRSSYFLICCLNNSMQLSILLLSLIYVPEPAGSSSL